MFRAKFKQVKKKKEKRKKKKKEKKTQEEAIVTGARAKPSVLNKDRKESRRTSFVV